MKFVPKLKSLLSNFNRTFCSNQNIEREVIDTDVLIIGGGPSGLATAIKLKNLAKEKNKELDVTIVEKGSEIGAHILSGNVLQTSSLSELIPNWKEKNAPLSTPVTKDNFKILFNNYSLSIPEFLLPSSIHNKGNYVISLSQLCRWLGKEAEELGVNIYTGFSANEVIFDENINTVQGILTNDFGISKKGEKKPTYEPGNIIKAKYTVFAEGCRGSLTERLLKKYNLVNHAQHYGLGLKEIWEMPDNHKEFSPGFVQHTVNWPLDHKTYGGSFMYHMKPNLIHLGFVVGLDYTNPYLNPYEEFQRFKTHKDIRKFLEGGRCIQYGSRTLNEGGYFSIPKLTFPGGLIVGDSAGFLNVSKVKGTHNAIKSGMIAANNIFEAIENNKFNDNLEKYNEDIKNSEITKELHESRNFHGGFKNGLFLGLIHGFITNFTKGKEFWNFYPKKKDSDCFKKAVDATKIDYPKHDGVLTFDLLENLSRSGTNHDHDQPSHLKIKKDKSESPMKSYNIYSSPEERFCPAKVYEFIKENDTPKLQINAQNCVHCKCCSIKMVDEYIDWNVPQGGEGPKYTLM